MKKQLKNLIIIALPALLSLLFFRNTIREFPSHIHAWAQADRYALALGFLNNGFDFFHPQTYNLNVQFPAKAPLKIEQGITAVDFPIHEYVIALIMKLTGCREPMVFRLYSLIYGLTGLFFLYRLTGVFLEDPWFPGFMMLIFTFTAPVYTWYMDGFLPSVTSLANCFIAYYFFFKYKKENKPGDFYCSVFFITIAALCRMPFAIFLIAMISQQVLEYYQKQRINRKEITAYLFSIVCIGGYFIYNAHLRNTYGSVFLSSLYPPESLSDLKDILHVMYRQWFYQYFTGWHYLFFLFVLIIAAAAVAGRKQLINALQRELMVQICIAGLGVALYFILMAHQYREHDYYFLDSFFTVIILMLLFFLAEIKLFLNKKVAWLIGVTAIVLFMFQSMKVQTQRSDSGSWDRYQATINNFKGADEFLSDNKVATGARILVIDAYTPNIPFILMNRKGYSVISTTKKEILDALKYKFDYVVIQNEFLLSDVLNNYPELKNFLNPIARNGKITLYTYSQTEKERSLIEFLSLDKSVPFIDESINFDDSVKSAGWANYTNLTDKYAWSGKKAAFVDSSNEYGVAFNIVPAVLDSTKSHMILFEGYFYAENDLKDILIAGYAGRPGVVDYAQYFDLSTYIKEKNKWTKVQFLYTINKPDKEDNIKVFIWNPKKKKVYYDDWRLRVY